MCMNLIHIWIHISLNFCCSLINAITQKKLRSKSKHYAMRCLSIYWCSYPYLHAFVMNSIRIGKQANRLRLIEVMRGRAWCPKNFKAVLAIVILQQSKFKINLTSIAIVKKWSYCYRKAHRQMNSTQLVCPMLSKVHKLWSNIIVIP